MSTFIDKTGAAAQSATYGADEQQRMGFFTDTMLCIGCKACEVACKEWNELPEDGYEFTGWSYDNTRELNGNTWRHVTFVEQFSGRSAGTGRWLMESDVCKHCTHAGCLDVCPTGAIMRSEFGTVVIQQDVCNGCGYCIVGCPFGVIGLKEAEGTTGKCTLCYDRLKEEPACAKACRRTRFNSARSTSCANARRNGWKRCKVASTVRSSTAPTRATASGGPARCSCYSISPKSTACRPIRSCRRKTCPKCGELRASAQRYSWPRASPLRRAHEHVRRFDRGRPLRVLRALAGQAARLERQDTDLHLHRGMRRRVVAARLSGAVARQRCAGAPVALRRRGRRHGQHVLLDHGPRTARTFHEHVARLQTDVADEHGRVYFQRLQQRCDARGGGRCDRRRATCRTRVRRGRGPRGPRHGHVHGRLDCRHGGADVE